MWSVSVQTISYMLNQINIPNHVINRFNEPLIICDRKFVNKNIALVLRFSYL